MLPYFTKESFFFSCRQKRKHQWTEIFNDFHQQKYQIYTQSSWFANTDLHGRKRFAKGDLHADARFALIPKQVICIDFQGKKMRFTKVNTVFPTGKSSCKHYEDMHPGKDLPKARGKSNVSKTRPVFAL